MIENCHRVSHYWMNPKEVSRFCVRGSVVIDSSLLQKSSFERFSFFEVGRCFWQSFIMSMEAIQVCSPLSSVIIFLFISRTVKRPIHFAMGFYRNVTTFLISEFLPRFAASRTLDIIAVANLEREVSFTISTRAWFMAFIGKT